VFTLTPDTYTDVCMKHEAVEINGLFERKELTFEYSKFRRVFFSVTTGHLQLPEARGNNRFTVARIDRYTDSGELDPFFRLWVDLPRLTEGKHRDSTTVLEPGKYRLVIFSEYRNPVWERDYKNLGSESWRKEWVIDWRKEYVDLHFATFEVPEWNGKVGTAVPMWHVKIDFNVEANPYFPTPSQVNGGCDDESFVQLRTGFLQVQQPCHLGDESFDRLRTGSARSRDQHMDGHHRRLRGQQCDADGGVQFHRHEQRGSTCDQRAESD
jgi:hypothetical protein